MPDFTSVPTVELLTRAADAAGKAAATISRLEVQSRVTWVDGVDRLVGMSGPRKSLAMASGPDHWRAVEALLRTMLQLHGPVIEPDTVLTGGFRIPGSTICPVCQLQFGRNGCDTLQDLHPLAEQVLQHLGDTE